MSEVREVQDAMNKKPGTSLAIIDEHEASIPQEMIDAIKILIPAQVLHNETEVRRELPQILGRLLAFSWINEELAAFLLNDTKEFLESINISLPPSIVVEVTQEKKAKPSITVYQIEKGKKFRQRLFKLSLKLMANR